MTEERMVRVSDPDVSLVQVAHAEGTPYRKLHGEFSWMAQDKALRGEAAGLWKICEEEDPR